MQAAGPEHAAALALIHAEAFAPGAAGGATGAGGAPWGPDAMALQLSLRGAFGFVDGRGGMVLARVVADEAEILTLAVAPAARRAGLGRALMTAAMDMAASRGAAAMFLEVAAPNTGALALYSALGFVQVGLRAGYYGVGCDALVMRASLVAGAAPRSS